MSVGTAKAKQSKARGQNRAGQVSSFFSPIAIGTVLFFSFYGIVFHSVGTRFVFDRFRFRFPP
jgi:cation transport ATPase